MDFYREMGFFANSSKGNTFLSSVAYKGGASWRPPTNKILKFGNSQAGYFAALLSGFGCFNWLNSSHGTVSLDDLLSRRVLPIHFSEINVMARQRLIFLGILDIGGAPYAVLLAKRR